MTDTKRARQALEELAVDDRAAVAAALYRLDTLEQVARIQPMSTAPRDRSVYLLFFHNPNALPFVGNYDGSDGCWRRTTSGTRIYISELRGWSRIPTEGP